MNEDIWAEDAWTRWPRSTGTDIFMAQAVDMIGQRLFGDEWKITDMSVRVGLPRRKPNWQPRPAIPPASIASDRWKEPKLSADEQLAQQRREYEDKCAEIDRLNAEAQIHNETFGKNHRRASDIQRAIVQQASVGALEAFYRSEIDGDPCSIPDSFWTVGDPFGMFRDCRVSGWPWMRPQDKTSRHAVFVTSAQLRSIDWKKVEWRPKPAPLGDPEPDHTADPSPVSQKQLREWVEARRAEGVSQARMVELALTGFPGHQPPSGNAVKAMDKDLGKRSRGRPARNSTAKIRSE